MNPVHFSSKTDMWATPPAFFAQLDGEFGFTLDACASPENAKCERYYTVLDDGLTQPWEGTVWCNPPYGREIRRWVEKAFESAKAGARVVMLIPARTDTSYWHRWIFPHAKEIRFVPGRLKFGDAKAGAPFPSAVVVF